MTQHLLKINQRISVQRLRETERQASNRKRRGLNLMEYQSKQLIVDASPWNQNGDHPDDNIWRPFEDTGKHPVDPREGAVVRYFRHPVNDGNSLCTVCNRRMHDHGWIDNGRDGRTVCPGDWIITNAIGDRYPCKNDLFEATFEPL